MDYHVKLYFSTSVFSLLRDQAVWTQNGGFKDFIVIYLAAFAALHPRSLRREVGTWVGTQQGTKLGAPSIQPHLARSCWCLHTCHRSPQTGHRSLSKSTQHIFLTRKTNAKQSKCSASVPCRSFMCCTTILQAAACKTCLAFTVKERIL